MAPRGFSLVDDLPPTPELDAQPTPQQQNPRIHAAAVGMLQLAIAELSKRFVVALASLFTLLTVGSAFYIWLLIIDNPTQYQITAASIFSGFILLINYLNMRRGK